MLAIEPGQVTEPIDLGDGSVSFFERAEDEVTRFSEARAELVDAIEDDDAEPGGRVGIDIAFIRSGTVVGVFYHPTVPAGDEVDRSLIEMAVERLGEVA